MPFNPSEMTLQELADLHRTDKGSFNWVNPEYGGHNYCGHYESIMSSFRNEPIKLLEIGIRTGASLKMWRDYFPNGQIFGIDNCEQCMFESARIKTFVGDQTDKEFLDEFGREHGPFDYIIDDGCHESNAQLASLEALARYTSKAYIIEDLLPSSSYNPSIIRRKILYWVEQIIYSSLHGWTKIEVAKNFIVLHRKKPT